jgi:hypothetical protein
MSDGGSGLAVLDVSPEAGFLGHARDASLPDGVEVRSQRGASGAGKVSDESTDRFVCRM